MTNKRASMHDGPLADLFRATDAAREADVQRDPSPTSDETRMMEPPVQAAPDPVDAPPVTTPHIQPVPDPVDEPEEAPASSRPAAAFARGDVKPSPLARDVSTIRDLRAV